MGSSQDAYIASLRTPNRTGVSRFTVNVKEEDTGNSSGEDGLNHKRTTKAVEGVQN